MMRPDDAVRVAPGAALRILVLAIVPTVAPFTLAAGPSADACLDCHEDTRLAGSAHEALSCADCHAGLDIENVPHSASPRDVDCGACHGDTASKHSFHAGIETPGEAPVIACTECHAPHRALPVAHTDSGLSGPKVAETCAKCHEDIVTAYRRSEHGRAAATGEAGAPTCLDCHRLPISPTNAGEAEPVALKIAQEKMCLHCHLDNPEVRARMGPDAGFIAAYERSVHGAALLAGNAGAANCVDCHGSHEMLHGMDPAARVSKTHIPGTCSTCHAKEAEAWGRSIHAQALGKGNTDAPVCTDCHGEHDILAPSDPAARVAAGNVSAQVCSPCHSSLRLSAKYGIASDRFRTFSDSFHGLALRGGSIEVANCASCHGAHEILPSSDPGSPTNKANLATTCGACHPGANERFAVGSVHVGRNGEEEPVVYWVASIYIILIVTTVGAMVLHNGLDFLRRAGRRMRIRRGLLPEPEGGHGLYLRMTLSERLQHGTLLVSFVLLVVTGFMLSYPEAWWVRGIRGVSRGAFEARGIVHRFAAVVMTLAALVHVLYLAGTTRGRALFVALLPRRKDLADAWATLSYNLHLSRARPRFGRFSYAEKVEYWALVWGTLVMAVTGTILWFENTFIGWITKLGWDVARTVHYYEAWLATLAIIVWHLYYVLVNPDVYPMSLVWITGRMTEAEMEDEHPLELEEHRARERAAQERETREPQEEDSHGA